MYYLLALLLAIIYVGVDAHTVLERAVYCVSVPAGVHWGHVIHKHIILFSRYNQLADGQKSVYLSTVAACSFPTEAKINTSPFIDT